MMCNSINIKIQFHIYHVQENYISITVVVIVNLGSFNSFVVRREQCGYTMHV
jgi:hypothetical protein